LTTSAGVLTTTYAYDAAGNLLSVTLPDGSALSNTYDPAHRLTAVADLFNQTTAFTFDSLGNRTGTSVLDVNGNQQLQHAAKFDALGRLTQDIGGAGQTTGFAYEVFDLIYLDGYSLTQTSLKHRKELLKKLVGSNSHGVIRYSEHISGNGDEFFKSSRDTRRLQKVFPDSVRSS